MRVFLEFHKIPLRKTDRKRVDAFGIDEDIRRFRATFAHYGWEVVNPYSLNEIVERMAAQLPDEDVDGFVTNVKFGMTRRRPRAWLTINALVDDDIARIRIRLLAHDNGALPILGRRVADLALKEINDYMLQEMLLWEQRRPEPILLGNMRDKERVSFITAARSNPQFLAPLIFAVVLVFLGGFYCHLNSQNVILGDTLWTWYGRVFAPLLVTMVTMISAIFNEQGSRRQHRFAEWVVSDS